MQLRTTKPTSKAVGQNEILGIIEITLVTKLFFFDK